MDISLIICNYNRASFIDRAIRSCVNQLIMHLQTEIIVIDDASTDNSLQVLKEFSKEINLYTNNLNRGVAYSSNIGLEKANGKYWMRVDADDFLNMHACAFMAMILDENPHISYVYCDHYRVDVNGFKKELVRLDTEQKLYEHGAGILFRTKDLRNIGGYDEKLRNCEDYDLLLRLKKNGYVGYRLPVPLYRYYIHGGNITLDPNRQIFKKIVENKHGI